MTEKVYGFRGEDIFIFEKKGKEHILVERIGDETISGNLAFELVPVVSLEWLENEVKKRHKRCTMDLNAISFAVTKMSNETLEDLLTAARKEAKK